MTRRNPLITLIVGVLPVMALTVLVIGQTPDAKIVEAVRTRLTQNTMNKLAYVDIERAPKGGRLLNVGINRNRLTTVDDDLWLTFTLIAQALRPRGGDNLFPQLEQVRVIASGAAVFKAVTLSAADAEGCGLGTISRESCAKRWKVE